jgi:hypothetical protein
MCRALPNDKHFGVADIASGPEGAAEQVSLTPSFPVHEVVAIGHELVSR